MGLSLVGCLNGYKTIICIPDKMSSEKINRLKAIGSNVLVCPTDAPDGNPDNYHTKAHHIGEDPKIFYPDQYSNPHNPEAHFLTTGPELAEQMDNKIDYVFIGGGTCGTIVGISKYLKKCIPNVKVIGIDTVNSSLSGQ